MELPHLGTNCALKQCNQLDFLPVKCDACSEVFCVHHYQYDNHQCPQAKNRNVQVPVCPLCSEPVVSRNRNELPDVAVSHHIDQYCKRNDKVKNRVIKSDLQSCSFKSCKQKDLIYIECKDCRSKYCIKHRHPTDHLCSGPRLTASLADNWQNLKGTCSTTASSSFGVLKSKAHQISKSGQAALNRLTTSNNRPNSSSASSSHHVFSNLQGNLTEQEALRIALSESQASGVSREQAIQQEKEDLALAKALQESQADMRNQQQTSTRDGCVLS